MSHHRKNCSIDDCPCNKSKSLKMMRLNQSEHGTYENFLQMKQAFLQMTLFKFIQSNNKDEQQQLKNNSILPIYIIFQEIYNNGNPYQGIYNLQKFHDCRNCSIQSCFQQFIIRKIADQIMEGKQLKDEDMTKYQQIVSYEVYLKEYLEIINKISNNVNEFWNYIIKKEIDILKAQDIGLKILKNYQSFQVLYTKFGKNGGDNMHIETLAWKIHFEVMNFEQESLQNFERIKTFANKRRVDAKVQNENNIITDSNIYLVVISGNPHNFQKILGFSKSFAKFSGYTDEFLLKNKITVMLPKVLDAQHEKLVKKYLKRKKNLESVKVTLSQSWLKKANGSLVPVLISVIPRIDVDQGLQLVGLVQRIKKINIFETNISSNSVFCILTDVNNKILHISQNCINYLQLPQELHTHDIFITNLFKGLPETLQDNQEFESILDLQELQTFSLQNYDNIQSSLYNARIQYKEKRFKGDNILKQFQFVMLGFAQQSQQQNSAYAYNPHNVASNFMVMYFTDENQHQRTQSGSKLVGDDSDSEQFQIQSMSSTSSGSSNASSQDAQVSDIKNSFEFSVLPISLKNYRIKIIIAFILLLITAIVLLAVNVQSKYQFTQDIEALRVEKTMRNAFSSSKLSVLYLYTFVNSQPKYLNQSQLSVPFNTLDQDSFFREGLRNLISNLHQSLVEFSQKQSLWDSSFVYKVSQQQLQALKITPYGNLQTVNSTFFKSVTLFVDYVDYIINTDKNSMKALNTDILKYNTPEQLRIWVKGLVDPLSTVIQYVFFSIYNGALSLLISMLEIDDSFISLIMTHGDNLINVILIFTICCCCVVAILFLLLLPYLFKIDTVQRSTINFLYLTDKEQITEMFQKNKQFQKYLLNQTDLKDENKFDQIEQQRDRQISIRKNANSLFVQQLNTLNSLNSKQPDEEFKYNGNEYNRKLGSIPSQNYQSNQPLQQQTDFSNFYYTTNNNLINENNDKPTLNFQEDDDNIQGQLNIRKKQDIQNRIYFNNNDHNHMNFENHQGTDIFADFHRSPDIQHEMDTKNNMKFANSKVKAQQIADMKYKRDKQYQQDNHKSKNTKHNNNHHHNHSSSDDENDEENSKGNDQNENQHRNNLHQLKKSTKEQQLNEAESHQLDTIRQKLQYQSKKSKIIISVTFFIISALIGAFYVVTYILSQKILTDFQLGFYQYDIFYTRSTCLTESIFFMQKTILFNETMGVDTYNGQMLAQIFDDCSQNEQEYRQIKKDGSGMFQGLSKDLEMIDSNQFCDFLINNGVLTDSCKTDVLGFLNLGLEQMISSILAHIYQKRISFMAKPRIERNADYLNRMFYQKDTQQYVLIYFKYIEWVFTYIQDVAHNTLSEQMTVNFNAIIATFSVFIITIVIISIITIIKLVNQLRIKLLRIRMLLKLMPSMEIYKNKDKLEKLDTKLL